MASEPRHSTSLVVVISNHRRRACGNAIPERVEASKRSHMIKSSLADQGRIAMANDVENRLIELMTAGAILDPAIMNNGSSDDVTRMRQAPTILQYSHQSRSQSDDLASLWLCRRQLGNSPTTDDPNVASKCTKNGVLTKFDAPSPLAR